MEPNENQAPPAPPTPPQTPSPQPRNMANVYPDPKPPTPPPKPVPDSEPAYKPHGTIASRVPQVKTYALVLAIGSVVFGAINFRAVQLFSMYSTGKRLIVFVYTILAIMFITGLTLLFSKSKRTALLVLNILIVVDVLLLILAILTLSVVSMVFAALIFAKVNSIRRLVNSLI